MREMTLQRVVSLVRLIILAATISTPVICQPSDPLARTRALITAIKNASFPELAQTDIRVQLFASRTDYFVTRLNLVRFFTGRHMEFIIKVNPQVFVMDAPEAGLRAILAHELGHVLWLQQQKRIRHLRLVQTIAKKYTAAFERRTDLEAIARGYGAGLASYREWLYQHIPPEKLAEKHRNYFSPAEITALQIELQQQPQKLAAWRKNPPLNLAQIK